ncbi:transcriptional regulator, GntR family [Caloramator quimbayensis]|uniref:Transcriptional regulator, GntR family n=1 Tax=Caloramator quimbayensis TaxID=1147123 RepID=A0A1T4WX26_9CLOT|nr:TrkA C-terminal domain-containing protein [Caloramator quimbayensis]SKA81435.1 transcriptional regulator, GntR family [Caloramator quimbayensis]
MRVPNGMPVYRYIALDIANKIVRGELKINEKISGRSTLAGMYNVSPETIRRAIAILEGMDVVSSIQGSGIEILSISAAEKFIEAYKNNEYLNTIKENIFDIVEKKKELDLILQNNLQKLIDYIERFKNISPFTLIEISIKESSWVIGKNLDEVKFWKNTGATIVAYRQGENIFVSPGPDYRFKAGDIIVVIGSSDVYEKVCNFIYEENEL